MPSLRTGSCYNIPGLMYEPIRILPATRTRGLCVLPGDKSICHRALILGSLSSGRVRIENLSNGEDIKATIGVLRSLGVPITVAPDGRSAVVTGRGGKFDEPDGPLDCGNSATTMRLMTGILASQPFESVLTGDESLTRRPMQYIADPLNEMGAMVTTSHGGKPPLTVRGGHLRGIAWNPGVASAQVKSAVLLAGLFADGDTIFHETLNTRDHTERLLENLGGKGIIQNDRIAKTIRVEGGKLPLPPFDIVIPGDPSSAAFPMALATLLHESSLTVPFVSINPGRIAFVRHLQAMGAHIVMTQDPHVISSTAGEPVGEFHVLSAKLKNVPIDPDRIPGMIDEIPLLAVVASLSDRDWEISGAERLREKETDRIATTAAMIRGLGGEVEEFQDGLRGPGGQVFTGGEVDCRGDHRIAMAAAVGAWCSRGPSNVLGAESVKISFPGFFSRMKELVEYN